MVIPMLDDEEFGRVYAHPRDGSDALVSGHRLEVGGDVRFAAALQEYEQVLCVLR